MKNLTLVVGAMVVVCTLFFYLYDHDHFNGIAAEEDRTCGQRLLNRAYFVLTTLSTVGYGDISPKSVETRAFTMLMMFGLLVSLHEVLSTSVVGGQIFACAILDNPSPMTRRVHFACKVERKPERRYTNNGRPHRAVFRHHVGEQDKKCPLTNGGSYSYESVTETLGKSVPSKNKHPHGGYNLESV